MPPARRSARTLAVPVKTYRESESENDATSPKADRDEDAPFSDSSETKQSSLSPSPPPSKSPVKRKTSKKIRKVQKEESDVETSNMAVVEEVVSSTKRKRKQSNIAVSQEITEGDAKSEASTPKRRKTMQKISTVAVGDGDSGKEPVLETAKPKPKKKKTMPPSDMAMDGEHEGDDKSASASPKKRKPRAPKPEPVYVIPDVDRLETTFRGRLGMFWF
jgi:UV DNA damage endonuclease